MDLVRLCVHMHMWINCTRIGTSIMAYGLRVRAVKLYVYIRGNNSNYIQLFIMYIFDVYLIECSLLCNTTRDLHKSGKRRETDTA